jgi:flagellar biosynthesis protein FliQ
LDHEHFVVKIIGEHEENTKKALQAINRFSERLNEIGESLLKVGEFLSKVGESLLTERDTSKVNEFITLIENLSKVKDHIQSWQTSSISLILQHIKSIDEIIDKVIHSNEERTLKRRNRIRDAIKNTKNSLIPKSRLYLIVLLIGMFFTATGELAIMNEFTGKILNVGSLSYQIEKIFQNRGVEKNLNSETGSAFQAPSNIDEENLSPNILNFFFLFCLSGLPFVLSFVTKAALDLRTEDLKKRTPKLIFCIAAGIVGVIYILSVAAITSLQQETWYMIPLIFSLSMSFVLIGGWLLHQFLQGYENFKQITGRYFNPFRRSRFSKMEEKIKHLRKEQSTKKEELEKIEKQIIDRRIENEKMKQLFGALDQNNTIHKVDIDTAREAAKESFTAGYELGRNSRKTCLLRRIWQHVVRIFNNIKVFINFRRH